MKVRARYKGYYAGRIREPGEKFVIPDDEWDDEKKPRPKWVDPVKTVLQPVEVAVDVDPDDDPENDNEPGEGAPEDRSKERKKKPEGNGVTEALGAPADWLPQGVAK